MRLLLNTYLDMYIYIYRVGFKLHHSIFFNWMQILTNPALDFIIFVYSSYLQNFEMIKN